MFHPIVISKIGGVISFLSKTQIYPFVWDKNRKTLRVGSSNRQLLIMLVYLFFLLFYVVYLACQLKIALSATKIDVSNVYWIGVFLSAFPLGVETVLSLELNKYEMLNLFTECISFYELAAGT